MNNLSFNIIHEAIKKFRMLNYYRVLQESIGHGNNKRQ